MIHIQIQVEEQYLRFYIENQFESPKPIMSPLACFRTLLTFGEGSWIRRWNDQRAVLENAGIHRNSPNQKAHDATGSYRNSRQLKSGSEWIPDRWFSSFSYKWWGSSVSDINEDVTRKEWGEDFQEDRKKREELVDDGANILLNDGEKVETCQWKWWKQYHSLRDRFAVAFEDKFSGRWAKSIKAWCLSSLRC